MTGKHTGIQAGPKSKAPNCNKSWPINTTLQYKRWWLKIQDLSRKAGHILLLMYKSFTKLNVNESFVIHCKK